MRLEPTTYDALPGWQQDAHTDALLAFYRSCNGKISAGGKWERLCRDALQVGEINNDEARRFFETHFTPYRVRQGDKEHGILTGYYVPVLHGAMRADARHRYPVYAAPPDLAKRTPYFTRQEIDNGALKGKGLELLWVDDPVMLFFMQVQGSGFVELPGGKTVRLRYAAKNGQPYHAIGKTLIERGALEKDNVSLQTIRAWLRAHPKEAPGIMQTNPSYIFFRLDESADHVTGAGDVALTPERSLATDPAYLTTGWPVYVETTDISRLLIAQDTGSAIKGPLRGDLFVGYGASAEKIAGRLNAQARFTLLVPNEEAQ